MEGSADDIGAPDSWEMADLDERMTRMMILSSKKPSARPHSPSPSDEPPSVPVVSSSWSAVAMAAVSGDRSGGISEEALNQVDQFLREALEKPRERLSILRMEQDVEKFLRDPTQQLLEFQALPTSYLRLAAHRIAQHYCLQSSAVPDNSLPDGSGSRIVLQKTSESRFPIVRLADIPVSLPHEDGNSAVKVAIKQRPQSGSQNSSNASAHSSRASHQKSVEERKEEYNRARTRIFSGSSSSSNSNSDYGTVGKSEGDFVLDDGFEYCSMVVSRPDERLAFEGPENNCGRGLVGSASDSSRSNKNKMDKEPVVSRYRASNRVAIFRDREVERKDPDYDRSYDRYMQRFDPGFGFSGGHYTIQPLFSPAVNYNTEFPQLGSGHRPQISIEQSPRPTPQLMRGRWPVQSAPSLVGYGPPEGMVASFNLSRVGSHPAPSMYMHPSQYSLPMRPGMSFGHPHEHVQFFPQTHQQQSEASFGLARPR